MAKIVIDAGHGGEDPGAVYAGRNEKDDALKLALAVGEILEQNGVDVEYTRTTDVFNTPFEKAQMANQANADYFVSIHRNALEPNTAEGVETLVYNDAGVKADIARAINENLSALGFANRGVIERPNLVVLKRTKMPAVLVEAGFIDSDTDNQLFDEKFNEIAQGIADGILDTLGIGMEGVSAGVTRYMDAEEDTTTSGEPVLYRVQVGAYENQRYAECVANRLQMCGFPAYVLYVKPYYKVQVGAYEYLDNAVRMERCLRNVGYDTYLTTE
jgi:N-acetylmuramoyl-L-alanine amidase